MTGRLEGWWKGQSGEGQERFREGRQAGERGQRVDKQAEGQDQSLQPVEAGQHEDYWVGQRRGLGLGQEAEPCESTALAGFGHCH